MGSTSTKRTTKTTDGVVPTVTRWVIYVNVDGTSAGMTTRYNWDAYPEQHHLDPDGIPHKIVKEFDANSYDDAKTVYDKHLGHT